MDTPQKVPKNLLERVSGKAATPPTPAPPAAAPAAAKPAEPAGGWARLAPATRERLVELGAREGDPLPADLPTLVAAGPMPQDEFRRKMLEMVVRETGGDGGPPAGVDPSVAAAAREVGDGPSDETLFQIVEEAAAKPADPDGPAPGGGGGESPTGVGDRTICPHCYFDLRHGEVPPVSPEDKEFFLATVPYGLPFTRQYTFFEGRLRLRFRGLARREVDAIYAYSAAYWSRKPNFDPFEDAQMKMRARLSLGLAAVFVVGAPDRPASERHFPEGLSKATRPGATNGTWEEKLFPDGVPGADEGERLTRLFEAVLGVVDEEVLVTEHLQRVADEAMRNFNRLVVHLEAMRDAVNFWPPIRSPSG